MTFFLITFMTFFLIPSFLFCKPMRVSLMALLLLIVSTSSSSSSTSSSSSNQLLSFNFYATSCPNVEMLVKNAVRSASFMDSALPGRLLRLLFHDCMVEGCDGSVLLEGNGTERSDPANTSLDGFSVVESIKRMLEVLCPGTVSCADILALAARDAVELTGGPSVQVPMGRRDGRISSASSVRSNIVDTSFTLDQMIELFNLKGLSLDDLVILSGAHTIGSAHCGAFNDRFEEDSNGKLKLIDKSLDEGYAAQLMNQCPSDANESTTVSNDPETAFTFDNQYYRNLVARKGLFESDSVLFGDQRTREQVEGLAESQETFFNRWGESFLKLTVVNVKTGGEGEIRRECNHVVNG